MKDKKKTMATNLVGAIETVINQPGEKPKKAVKAVKNIAKKVAGQMIKNQRGKNERLGILIDSLPITI